MKVRESERREGHVVAVSGTEQDSRDFTVILRTEYSLK